MVTSHEIFSSLLASPEVFEILFRESIIVDTESFHFIGLCCLMLPTNVFGIDVWGSYGCNKFSRKTFLYTPEKATQTTSCLVFQKLVVFTYHFIVFKIVFCSPTNTMSSNILFSEPLQHTMCSSHVCFSVAKIYRSDDVLLRFWHHSMRPIETIVKFELD